jgi:predicted negative regulator of RcsB-dependent stress response
MMQIRFRRFKRKLLWQSLHDENKIMLQLKKRERKLKTQKLKMRFVANCKIRLADAQLRKRNMMMPKNLINVTDPALKAADELRGDIYVQKMILKMRKKRIKQAWDAVERKQERQILQIKLESVGVLVDDPEIERPILETQVDES